ncbi:CAAX amino terminal protease family protein [Leucobacter sp. 7(1)]|uniref:CPBP family intramembrane glutamic endopeptidase n=1 Tax=Leucobacter sp. 7(1) TaxID=1255613 RepID=UPI00097F2C38|nr:CPBP family intramembrane glutamic endopeptidase [Leucobacter sp. 7(1)]SJN10644.1 CAAX amino terminal protease family protein [Leucobacter sp. 7(1)]
MTYPAAPLSRVPWGAVALFTVLALGLAWLIALPLWLGDLSEPGTAALFGPLVQAMMFTPLLATLAVVFLLRVPRGGPDHRGARLRFLGMWPLRPAKRVVWFTVGAMFAPIVVIAASIAVAAAFGWVTLDLVHFSGFAETLAATVPEDAAALLPPAGTIALLQLLSLPFGVIFNCIFTFGEELGWRGWLLPALRPLGTWPALVISGVIWGLWHSPVILLGYNFGLLDWRGVALMTVACVLWGILLGWSRLRTGSVWPAVVGHAALNAGAALVVLVSAAGAELDPVLVLPLGVAGWIAVAAVIVVLVLTGQFSESRQPPLADPRPRVILAPHMPAATLPGSES